MNKTKLQQELKEKVKPGIKPSQIKKHKANNSQNISKEDNIVIQTNKSYSNQQLLTPPPTPPLKPTKTEQSPSPIVANNISTPPDSPLLQPTKPSKPANNIKELQEQVKYWSQTANNYLLNLSKTSAELFEAEKKIKKLESQGINKELEKALIEANGKIRELEKSLNNKNQSEQQKNKELLEKISKLEAKNNNLNKTIETMKNQTKNKEKDKEEQVKTKIAETPTQPKYYLFTCDICEQNKRSQLHRERVNGLGVDPNKINKICDACIKRVDIIKNTEQDYIWE